MRFFHLLAAGALLSLLCGCAVRFEQQDFPEELHPAPDTVAVFHTPGSPVWTVYGSRKAAEQRFIPCSTFKIVSTLMGLDAGIVSGPDSKLGYDGTKYEYDSWNAELPLKDAFRLSCVWYYKKLIGRLEKSYVQNVLDRLHYGNRNISVWNSNGHNVFWIESSLLISPVEQIRMLEHIFSGQSGFRADHVALLKQCMRRGSAGPFAFYGKTGTGRNHNTNRLESWFVGFAEHPDGQILYFAAHAADLDRNVSSAELQEKLRQLVKRLRPDQADSR